MARRVAAWRWRRQTYSSMRAMAGSEAPALRANSSASRTLSPEGTMMGVLPGAASASAIRAIDEPMTRAMCRPDSSSNSPMAIMARKRWRASMSISVKTGSVSPTSRNPRARQMRLATSRGMPVRSATSCGVMRRSAGTSMRSTISRSTVSSATARVISSSVAPRSSSMRAHPGQGLGPPLLVRPGPWVRAVELDDARAGGGAVVVLAARPASPGSSRASPGTRSWPVAPSGRRSPRPGSAPRRAGRRPGGRSAPPHRRRRPAPPSAGPS